MKQIKSNFRKILRRRIKYVLFKKVSIDSRDSNIYYLSSVWILAFYMWNYDLSNCYDGLWFCFLAYFT